MIDKLASKMIGQRLRLVREARRATPETVATALHIRLRYVEAMEKGEFDAFPSLAQARGFLRTYTQYLNLPLEPFLAALDGDTSLLEQENDSGLGRGPTQGRPPTMGLDAGTPPGSAAPAGCAASEQEADHDGPSGGYPQNKFDQVGQKLRQQRETLGLTLEDVEQHTRLRAFYLKALESGNLDSLPSPVQGRGMLKNYASFLGLDAEALLLVFAEGLQERLAARQPPRLLRRAGLAPEATAMGTPPLVGSPPTRLITTDLLLAGVLVLFLIAFVVWGAIRISTMSGNLSPTATAPGISDVLAQVGTPTLEGSGNLTAAGGQPTATEPSDALAEEPTQEPSATPPPEFSSASVQVIISVRLRSWMRVTVDGEVAFEGRVVPGTAFPFAGDESVEILTGNGAGLAVNFNQTDLGTLGVIGEAVQRVLTVQGMQTPTPTATRTPAPATITPTPSPTARE